MKNRPPNISNSGSQVEQHFKFRAPARHWLLNIKRGYSGKSNIFWQNRTHPLQIESVRRYLYWSRFLFLSLSLISTDSFSYQPLPENLNILNIHVWKSEASSLICSRSVSLSVFIPISWPLSSKHYVSVPFIPSKKKCYFFLSFLEYIIVISLIIFGGTRVYATGDGSSRNINRFGSIQNISLSFDCLDFFDVVIEVDMCVQSPSAFSSTSD